MTTKQQAQTLEYFQNTAETWKQKASAADDHTVNIIQQRNDVVLEVIRRRGMTRSALDVGSGTGDLVCEIARRGIEATGVDFAEEMVRISETRAQSEALEKATFIRASIFEFGVKQSAYDVISANGFIEYISSDELVRFFDLVYDALYPGGDFVVGSRNRLFNIFSSNSFTQLEIEGGHVSSLLNEAVVLASGTPLADLASIDAAPLQPANTQHVRTGIDVETRYQFTPAQLIQMLAKRNFSIVQLYAIHIHGAPPGWKNRHPQIHAEISNLLQRHSTGDPSLIPSASSFVLHARRER